MELNPEQRAFREDYIKARGYWVDFNDGLLQYSPAWLEAYLAYADAPSREGPLEPRLREMIYVAIDTSTTHLFTQGLAIHVRVALECGCSASELIEVMQIATMQGLDSLAAGMPILVEEAERAGIALPDSSGTTLIVERYEALFGESPEWLEAVCRLFPAYADALCQLLLVANREGGLSERERTLIRLALASSPTHLNRPAIREETRKALQIGVSPAEIAEVFQLAAHLGIHACVDGVPLVVRAEQNRA